MTDGGFLDALLSMPVLAAPKVSPDGRWVAWSWFRLAGSSAADVFAAPTDASSPPVRLTSTEDDTLVVSWTPDGASLIVSQDHDGDERDRLYRVDLDRPGVLQPLTGPNPNYYIRGGQLHPNGRWLVYAANVDDASGEEIERPLVYRQDVSSDRSDERRVLARPSKPCFPDPRLSPSGEHVLYHRSDRHPAGRQVWLVGIGDTGDREILNFGPRTKVSASWLPETANERVLFTVESGTHRRLGIYDPGDESVRWILDDPQRNLEYAFAPPAAAGGPVVAVEVEEARVKATLLDPGTGREERPQWSPESGNLIPLSPTSDGAWVGMSYGARQPPDLLRFTADGSPASVTRIQERTPLDLGRLAAAEDYRWRSGDGLEVQAWLYRTPESASAEGTIVLIHGGPTSHAEDRFNAQVQYFVSRGFNVLVPNYRGSTGFGLDFQEKIKEDGWGGREQEDIKSGIEALIRDGIAAPGRVGVTGTSYGGYSAWWQITHSSPHLVAAAAPVCGMTDLVVDYETTRPDLRPYSEEMMGGSPEEVPDRYRERSPINHLQNIRGQLLIVQGQKDPNVTPENVAAVTKVLEQYDIFYELLTFEDEGHGTSRPENLKTLYPRLADFFEETFAHPSRPRE